MKNKVRIIVAAIVAVALFTHAIYAGGKIDMESDSDRYADAILELRKYDGLTDKQVAKLEGISLSKLKESKKIKDGEIIHDVEIGLFRSAVCPNCHNGRMINHGNKCLDYRSTGEQRACIHKAYGTDLRFERTCQAIARCEACGYLISSQWTESRWDCHGYNS